MVSIYILLNHVGRLLKNQRPIHTYITIAYFLGRFCLFFVYNKTSNFFRENWGMKIKTNAKAQVTVSVYITKAYPHTSIDDRQKGVMRCQKKVNIINRNSDTVEVVSFAYKQCFITVASRTTNTNRGGWCRRRMADVILLCVLISSF